jgi:hypothetical protein
VAIDSYWWSGQKGERYWLEFTDRRDLGADLRAPEVDESGAPNWRYSLFKLTQPGDIVFHYHKHHDAIVAASRVAGLPRPQSIVWGARGTFARAKGVKPHERAGYAVPLSDFVKLPTPLTLETLRMHKTEMRAIVGELQAKFPRHALYFPFELAERPVRALQGYAFKLPDRFVQFFDLYEGIDGSVVPEATAPRKRGTSKVQGFAPFEIRRAIERRAMALALVHYRRLGFKVENVSLTSPYDVLATKNGKSLLVEVKGTIGGGEAVFLTKNEVENVRQHPGGCALFVVHGMSIDSSAHKPCAIGGSVKVYEPWEIDVESLEPLQFRYWIRA